MVLSGNFTEWIAIWTAFIEERLQPYDALL